MKEFYSNGKLLLSGEYAVLDGAKALVVPTKKGQTLQVSPAGGKKIYWQSKDEIGNIWYEAIFDTSNTNFKVEEKTAAGGTSQQLQIIFKAIEKLKPGFFAETEGYQISTKLNFNRSWGLGSSSTLINNLAQWLKIDAYELLKLSFGGSGFDVAAAQHNLPITYQLTQNGPSALTSSFNPSFKKELFFVYLNEKQNSRQAIAHYRNQTQSNIEDLVEKVSALTNQFISCTDIGEFELLLTIHETLLSKALGLPKVKQRLFRDYPGAIKSLGGWGGDFVLATGKLSQRDYFRNKGYSTQLEFSDLKI